MNNLKVEKGGRQEAEVLDEKLEDYNLSKRPLMQDSEYVPFIRVIRDNEGKVIAGAVAYSSMYYIGYLETLWVSDEYRRQGLGHRLLETIENDLKEFGCENCHLDTFDFQGPEFYEAQGYSQFGKIEHKKVGITEYFFVKSL